jgi:glucokinase
MAVIAAGTGLGEAILYWDGSRHHALPTEGGHADFAPNDAWEDGLLVGLRHRLGGHVSYERILSGPGLYALYEYCRDAESWPELPEFQARLEREDPAAVVAEAGLSGQNPRCRTVLRRFARIYGAEAGNLALKSLACGGVIVAGGVAPKILPALTDGAFLEGFLAKGRFRPLLEKLAVRVALDAGAPLLGAARRALECAGDR